MIVDLTQENIKDIAFLHQAILPKSPIPQLGKRFMVKFYYPNLLADPNSFCNLFYFQEKPVGFISYTKNSQKLFKQWLFTKGHRLLWQMMLTILENPGSIKAILSAILLVTRHQGETKEIIQSEILSFGVLPEYRTLEFYRQEKIKIANELFSQAKKVLTAAGIKKFKLATNQSQDYIVPNIFYRNQGMKVLESKHIRGFDANIYFGEL